MRGLAILSTIFLFAVDPLAAHAGEVADFSGSASRFSRKALSESVGHAKFPSVYLSISPEHAMRSSAVLKKPGLALLLSAAVPGTGQFYVGSQMRAGIYLAVEAVGWFGWSRLRGEGTDLEGKHKDLANQFWDYDRWKMSSCFADGGTHDIDQRPDGSPVKNGEYYENIGKYEQFNCGWQNAVKGSRTQQREDYLKLRHDSNGNFQQARNFGTVIMFNHILSAIDAVWSAKRVNDRAVTAKIRIAPALYGGERVETIELTLKW